MPKAGWKKNPETGKFEPPAEPPVEQARFDADDAPIDGDYGFDQVVNKDPSKTYALVHQDDMPRMIGRGYVPTLRSADGAKPLYANEGEGDYIVNGQLRLMEIAKERADRIQAQSERRGAARWKSQQQAFNAGSSVDGVTHRTEKNEHVANARTWS